MFIYALYFIIPVIAWILIMKVLFHVNICAKEMGLQILVSVILLTGLFAIASSSMTYDTKLVNGVVTQLEPIKKNCNQFWSDWSDSFCTNEDTRRVPDGETCSTDSNGRRSCVTNYKTQYRSIYPWERRYFVRTDIGESYEITREDRQGVRTPARFAMINIDDPVTVSRGYKNYIQAASHSLFNKEPAGDAVVIAYPKVADYYRANRVMFTGVPVTGSIFKDWNDDLAKVNSNIRKKGANVVIVVTNDDRSFPEMLARAWHAHNINDIVVVLSTADNAITAVDVRSWSKTSAVNIGIRDAILDINSLDYKQIDAKIEEVVEQHYTPKDMADFEYLAADVSPPTWAMIIAALIMLVVTPGLTYVFNKHELFK